MDEFKPLGKSVDDRFQETDAFAGSSDGEQAKPALP